MDTLSFCFVCLWQLLEADRGVLEESLIAAKKDKDRLTTELLRAKNELKRTKKRLQEYEGCNEMPQFPAEKVRTHVEVSIHPYPLTLVLCVSFSELVHRKMSR